MRSFLDLTKFGITLFVLATALAGYAVSFPVGHEMDPAHPLILVVGLYLVSAGSFALNQAQEWRIDALMPRTQSRPLVTGLWRPWQAYLIGGLFLTVGLFLLYVLSPVAALLSALTVLLYNGLYTVLWKKRWVFGAVPGAIPGAMPVVIGYAVNNPNIFSAECVYLFFLMFLWQMPHFWSLAIRFKEDYKKGGIPVLPVTLGTERTLYHIGLYVFAYVGVAVVAPWFMQSYFLHLFLVLPIAFKVMWEFLKYFKAEGNKNWLPFFLWVNLSILVFVGVPAAEKWLTYLYYTY